MGHCLERQYCERCGGDAATHTEESCRQRILDALLAEYRPQLHPKSTAQQILYDYMQPVEAAAFIGE